MKASTFFASTLASTGFALLASIGSVRADYTVYSNVTSFSGSAYSSGGATISAGNTSTKLVADDITFAPGAAGLTVDAFTFSVANLNTSTVSARADVRFYADNGTGGGPGTLLGAFNFNPLNFAASSVSLYTFAPGTGLFTIPASDRIWAGIFFDNNGGATGASASQLNNLGQGIFAPPTVGSSADIFFQSTAADTFTTNSPAGTFNSFGGRPTADFGWEFRTSAPAAAASVPDGGATMLLLGLGLAALAAAQRQLRWWENASDQNSATGTL